MEAARKRKWICLTESVFTLLLGSVLYALGYVTLIAPHSLVLGGATGIATVFFSLWRVPVGLCVFLVNFPLIVWSCFVGGWRSTVRAMMGILTTSACLTLFAPLSAFAFSHLWGAILGGAVTGAGIGLLLTVDYTTGGSELAASLLLRRRRRHLTVGRLVLLFDTVIVLFATFLLEAAAVLPYSVALNLSFALFLDLFMRMGARMPYPIKSS